jgi:integrase/recombinase XerD
MPSPKLTGYAGPGDRQPIRPPHQPVPKLLKLLPAFHRWLRMSRYAESVQKQYIRTIKPFLTWLEEKGIEDISRVNKELLFAYNTRIVNAVKADGKPYSAESLASKITTLKAFFRWLHTADHILTNPAQALPNPRVPKEIKREPLSEEEIHALFKVIPTNTPEGYRDRAIVEVLYGTGIRISELTALALNDIHLKERVLVVRKGKGGKGRMVPLSTWAAAYLKGYLKTIRPHVPGAAAAPYLFLSRRGRRVKRWDFSAALQRYGNRAEIEKDVTPHVLRHTFACHLLKRGADIRAIQEMLGHESITSTQRYTKIEIGDLKAVFMKCHPRERYRSRVPEIPSVLTLHHARRPVDSEGE